MTRYPASSVPPRLQSLLAAAEPIAAAFAGADRRLYLVGGSVRDALVGDVDLDGIDLDLTTDARPEEILALLRGVAEQIWEQGRSFGTIGARVNGRAFEITTHRAEVYRSDSRKPTVTYGDDVEVDLSRRDFTINAMALDLESLRLVDPFGGAVDLAQRRLATPLDPEVSFGDDPLRMLRAARFIARFDLVADESLVQAARELAPRLQIVSSERIRDELDKMLMVEVPSVALWFVVRTGLSSQFLPELDALALEQDPIHRHKDVLAHTLAVVDKTSADRLLRLSALFHDVGKPKTRAFGPDGVNFHHHEVVGARMTMVRMNELRYPTDDVGTVSRLVELHLRFHTYKMGWTDRAVRRYVRDAGEHLARLNELTRCDCTTRNAKRATELGARMDELEARIADLSAREELDAMRPELDGEAVMARLGIAPGRAVGEALEFLLDLRLDEGLVGADEAARRLDEWWSARQEGA
ncbi:MAG TPA: CCA tRNA nucleotidyltransferase [Acidimicrobiales bacterium]|nr:CCA tRNA nucleotidyltransferase [Acidimicrobiales bacterium]